MLGIGQSGRVRGGASWSAWSLLALLAFCAASCDAPGDAASGRDDSTSSSSSTDSTPIVSSRATTDTAPTTIRSEPGSWLVSGEPVQFDLYWHCGVGLLAETVNGQLWRADEADERTWIPVEWMSMPDGFMTVDLVLGADGTTMTATRNGRSVTYAPTTLRKSDFCA